MGKETAPVCLFHIFCIKLKNIQKSIEKKKHYIHSLGKIMLQTLYSVLQGVKEEKS